MIRRLVILASLLLFPFALTPSAASAQAVNPDCKKCDGGGDSAGVVTVVIAGGRVTVIGGGGGGIKKDRVCKFSTQPTDGAGGVDLPAGTTIIVCAGPDAAAGPGALGIFIPGVVVNGDDLFDEAMDGMRDLFPITELLYSFDLPVSGRWTALALEEHPWEPVSATSSALGFFVTATGTPLKVTWDTGPVNPAMGQDGLVECDGPGDLPWAPAEGTCKIFFYTSTAGLGGGDRVTFTAEVEWTVVIATNVPGLASGPAPNEVQPLLVRDDVPVAEHHSIVIGQ